MGRDVSVIGPIRVENAGRLILGNHVELKSSWHKPIGLFVTRPAAQLTIGEHTFVNWGVTIGVASSITIGAWTQIGDECLIYDSDWHSIDGIDANTPVAPTVIGNGVWLGARVTVLKGVTIGDNTVVAANATVTADLPEQVLAAGTPAKPVRTIQRQR